MRSPYGDSGGGISVSYDVEIVGCRLRLKGGRELNYHTQGVVLRWLRRGTDRRVNGPSLRLETEYVPALRQWHLYASADSVSGDAPKYLEDVVVEPAEVSL
jgi:hypothetical protein